MLNRRHLRVKVLQNLYAYHQSEDRQLAIFEKSLLENVDQVYEMYIWLLNLLIDVADFTLIDADERANKHLPTEKDLNNNTRLENNTFIRMLRENQTFKSRTRKYDVSWHHLDPELVRQIFQQLKQSKEYEAYINDDDVSISTEKDIIKFIFKRLILKSPAIEHAFEEKFINWQLDKEVLQAMVAKTFKNFQSLDPLENELANLTPNWVEDEAFISKLFAITVRRSDEYQAYITAKTKNWEADRIALMDTLIMRLAIAELINFPSIPIKVTINEYIEISKVFSTPKSNSFINGILDKVLTDLRAEGRINKIGRGLVE
jgi:N utilization substance protein B